jgi:predicted nucleotidyltransferase
MILTEEYITQVITSFFKEKPVRKVWLFGSYARGEADEDSDVDVLVDIEYRKGIASEYLSWKDDLSFLLKKKIDIVSAGWESKFVKPYIDKDKVIIYEK